MLDFLLKSLNRFGSETSLMVCEQTGKLRNIVIGDEVKGAGVCQHLMKVSGS
jgi:hypothetical protein